MIGNLLHPNSKAMLQAWQKLGRRPATAVGGAHALASTGHDPLVDEHRGMIGLLFVLGQAEAGVWTFRTAGEHLSDILGRELVEQDFMSLFQGADRTMVSGLISAIVENGRPGIVRARGETLAGRRVEIEMPIAPLLDSEGRCRRLLGLYQHLGGRAMLGGRPVWRHRVSLLSAPDVPAEQVRLRLVASND